MISAGQAKIHWNYFIALEHDLETLSRYVELSNKNLAVYSIELAHLLFAAASEVDVIAKLLCDLYQPGCPARNIDEYRPILLNGIPNLPKIEVFVPRYALSFKPWLNWEGTPPKNPDWWRSYNNVKHERDTHFHEATLQHVLNAMGALLIVTTYLYSWKLSTETAPLRLPATSVQLNPIPRLFALPDQFYFLGC